MLTQPPVPFGRYELVHRLEQGPEGAVHLARLTGAAGFEKLYVLKTLALQPGGDSGPAERFQHEARLLVNLRHSNIAQVYELGEVDGTYFMAMEYVPGVDLGRVLGRARQLGAGVPIAMALYVGQQVAEALGYAHRKKVEGQPLEVVHRAVAPRNVMVSFEGEVKVLDFGQARSVAAAALTLPSAVVGRLGYMSPEQARAEKADARSDIYSAGVVLWEMLAGRRLYEDMTEGELLAAMAHPAVPPLRSIRPDVSPFLEAVVHRALAPAASERYARAEELARALNEARLHEGLHAGPEEVRAWIRSLCARELAGQRELVARLVGQGTGATASGAVAPVRAGSPSRREAPVTGRAPSPALAGASAARGRALLLGLGGVCLVLAGALGAVLLMPVQAGMGARDDAPMAARQDEGSAVAEVRTAEARGAGAVNSPAQGAGAPEAPVQGAGTAGASVQGAGAAGAPVQGTGTAEAWAQGAGAAEASAQGVGTPEAVGAASTARLADGQEAGAEDAPVPPAEEPAPTYERVTVDKVYEVLEDRGDHYLRAGGADGVGLGTEVRLLGLAESDGRRPLYGEAVVMELKGERLARLRPDKRPPAGSALFASFTPEPPKDKPRPTPRRQELRTAREPAAPTPVAAAQPVAAAPEPPPLQGRADVSGFGPVRRVIIYNREQRPWTRCELRLPNNRRFSLDKLAAGDQLAIALVKFRQDGPGQDLPLTWVSITCEQGRAKLSLRGG